MSKKSRKRNRKLLGVLAAGLGAVALANRKARAASIADNEAKESGFGQMKLKDYGPHTIGGGAKTPTSWITKKVVANNTNKQPQSISRNTGITIGAGGNKVAAQTGSKVPYIRRAADTARLNKMRAFRSNDAYRGIQRPVVQDVFTDSGVSGWGQGAKDGGRIGKRSGGKVKLAKRGFGRAFTKAKK